MSVGVWEVWIAKVVWIATMCLNFFAFVINWSAYFVLPVVYKLRICRSLVKIGPSYQTRSLRLYECPSGLRF